MRYSLPNFVILLSSIAGLITLLFTNFNYQNFDVVAKFCLLFSYTLCSFVIILYIFKKNLFNYIPLFPLTCFFFLVCYLSISFFSFESLLVHPSIDVSNISYAIKILTLGIFFLILGFVISIIIFKKINRKGFSRLDFSINQIFIYGLIINFLTIIFYYFIKIQLIFPFLAQVKYTLLFLSFGLFTNSFYQTKNLYDKKNFIIIFSKLLVIYVEILSGSYALPFILIFLDYLYFSYLKKKIILTPIAILFLIFFIVHEGKKQYREITWTNTNENIFQKSARFYKVYSNNYDNKFGLENLVDGNSSTHKRIAHSFKSLVIVTSITPKDIPYWNGYTYKILISKIVPRVFWKNKPSDKLGNEFGQRYKILINNEIAHPHTNTETFTDLNTSWNMPVLNEFFVNFGLRGVIIGMSLIGFIFGFITKFFTLRNNQNIEGIISFYQFVPLFFLESHLSLVFGAIIQTYIFLLVISLFFSIILKINFKSKL